MERGQKIFLITNGCPENRIDLARMQEFLKGCGWTVTRTVEDADILLFNSCGLTQHTEDVSINIVQQLQARKKSSAELIVCGCLPKIHKSRLREVYRGVTFGSDEIERLPEIFGTDTSPQDFHANFLLPYLDNATYGWRILDFRKFATLMWITERLASRYYQRLDEVINVFHPYSFCIKASTGCVNACTFCAVKISRGGIKSKPINRVVDEFDKGLEKGYTEFALIGTDLGSYGRDQGTTLAALLKELLNRKGEYQIRVRNIQPKFLIEMLPELRNIFQSGRIRYIGSAVESGNNRILKLMNRGYNIEDYKNAIRMINREFPDIQIRTQLLVGFPSETEEEFQDTLRLLDELHFDFAETYMFEPRPNTKAAAISDQIPKNVAKRRYHKLYIKSLLNQRERKQVALKTYKKNYETRLFNER